MHSSRLVVFFSLICCALTCGALHSETMLKRVGSLKQGDVVVYDFHNSISVIQVLTIEEPKVQFRLVTATKDVLSRENIPSWTLWLQKGVPGASTDEILSIDPIKKTVHEKGETRREEWLATLLSRELTPVPDSARRRAGPLPMSGEIDLRPLFSPKIIVHGMKVESGVTVFSTRWPDDGSDLSGRVLILYFPTSPQAVQAFPYWIESPSSSYHVSVIDSTHHLQP